MEAKHTQKQTGTPKYLPAEISDADIAFGGNAMEILPPWGQIPDVYEGAARWKEWASDWFFRGLDRYPVPREGIDLTLAMRNLSAVMRSFAPKHEHKEAGVAYLASLWFSSPDGQPISKATQ